MYIILLYVSCMVLCCHEWVEEGGGGEKYLNRNAIMYYHYYYYYYCYFLHPCPKTTPGAALGVKCVLYKQDPRRLDGDDHDDDYDDYDDNRSAARKTKRISPYVPAVAKNPLVVKKTASPGGRFTGKTTEFVFFGITNKHILC